MSEHEVTSEVQSMEEMLERWHGVKCTCDLSVGHLCEVCHDIQVLRNAITERDSLREQYARLAAAARALDDFIYPLDPTSNRRVGNADMECPGEFYDLAWEMRQVLEEASDE